LTGGGVEGRMGFLVERTRERDLREGERERQRDRAMEKSGEEG
jgi:hypothetical protein